MNHKIEYRTGRTYDAPQVLKIQILHHDVDEFNFITGKALFVDHSRHIAGTVDFFAMNDTDAAIGKGVLAAYDKGDYGQVIFSHVS